MRKNYLTILFLLAVFFSFAQMRDVTFSVDMSGQSFTQAYVSGSFNGWSGDSNALTDQGGGIWSATLQIPDGTYEYKFTVDNWAGQENFTSGQVCTITNGGFSNRFLDVNGSNITLSTPTFGTCVEDSSDPGPHDITLTVDMSGYGGSFASVYVSGSFNGWNGTSNIMTDMGGGLWSATISFTEAQHEFKFTIDDWTDQEFFNQGDPYTVTNGGFTNRFLQADGAKSQSYVWAQGEVLGIEDNELIEVDLSVYPNPSKDLWNIISNAGLNSVEVFDILGKQVLSLLGSGSELSISSDDLGTGIYLAKINTDLGTKTIKLIKE